MEERTERRDKTPRKQVIQSENVEDIDPRFEFSAPRYFDFNHEQNPIQVNTQCDANEDWFDQVHNKHEPDHNIQKNSRTNQENPKLSKALLSPANWGPISNSPQVQLHFVSLQNETNVEKVPPQESLENLSLSSKKSLNSSMHFSARKSSFDSKLQEDTNSGSYQSLSAIKRLRSASKLGPPQLSTGFKKEPESGTKRFDEIDENPLEHGVKRALEFDFEESPKQVDKSEHSPIDFEPRKNESIEVEKPKSALVPVTKSVPVLERKALRVARNTNDPNQVNIDSQREEPAKRLKLNDKSNDKLTLNQNDSRLNRNEPPQRLQSSKNGDSKNIHFDDPELRKLLEQHNQKIRNSKLDKTQQEHTIKVAQTKSIVEKQESVNLRPQTRPSNASRATVSRRYSQKENQLLQQQPQMKQQQNPNQKVIVKRFVSNVNFTSSSVASGQHPVNPLQKRKAVQNSRNPEHELASLLAKHNSKVRAQRNQTEH